jgi:P27 family predicted phage terminase small subunit
MAFRWNIVEVSKLGQRGRIRADASSQRARDRAFADQPEMPKRLSAIAKTEWTRVTCLLRNRDLLDALDQNALADYVTCWERLQQCEAEISRYGVLVEGSNGRGRVKNPAVQLSRQYRDALMSWSKELGLTVASRTRLSVSPPGGTQRDAKDEIERILSADL